MSATTPLWVSVFLAVLTPVLTLVGVLWTQRAADNRAAVEAKLRLDHERRMAALDRVLRLYDDLMVTGTKLVDQAARTWETPEVSYDYALLLVRSRAIASPEVYKAVTDLEVAVTTFCNEVADSVAQGGKSSAGVGALFLFLEALQKAIHAELRMADRSGS